MKSVEETALCQVSEDCYAAIFGNKAAASVVGEDAEAEDGAGAEGGESGDEESESDEDPAGKEQAAETKAVAPTHLAERHLFPFSAPEMFYRNAVRAFQPPLDLVTPKMKVMDLRPGAGLACLGAVRDGFPYHCFAYSEKHRAWLFQRTVCTILMELVLGTPALYRSHVHVKPGSSSLFISLRVTTILVRLSLLLPICKVILTKP